MQPSKQNCASYLILSLGQTSYAHFFGQYKDVKVYFLAFHINEHLDASNGEEAGSFILPLFFSAQVWITVLRASEEWFLAVFTSLGSISEVVED